MSGTPIPSEQLLAEASCPVCLELFQDPVSIPCGHSFCRGCIERCSRSSPGPLRCPRCRSSAPEPGLRPNRELARVVEIARGLLLSRTEPGLRCGRHREPLELFCREERALLCPECGRSCPHRVVPAEEAAREYKEQIQNRLRDLREEREKFLESRKCGRSPQLERARSEGQRLEREFRELRRFLEQQERLILARLRELSGAIGRDRDRDRDKVRAELAELETLHWEMEGKFQQPPSRFLQDLQKLLDSCERMKFQPPAEISPELEKTLEDFGQRNVLVRGALRRCQDSLMFLLQEPADVTLDPRTAHRHLRLSADGKEARGQLQPGPVPDHPERFDFEPCVLARGGFTSGRHFWEVELEDLKNELEKRQAKKIPEISPAEEREEKNQQLDVKSSISRFVASLKRFSVRFFFPRGIEEGARNSALDPAFVSWVTFGVGK